MTTEIPRRLRACFLDNANWSMSSVWEPQIQMSMDLEGELDRERLQRALRLTLDAEPVLGCRYVPRWIVPYWRRVSDAELDTFAPLEVVEEAETIDERHTRRFLSEEMRGDIGPQVRAQILPGQKGDRLNFKINHQVVDAGGTKAFAYLLAEIYRELGQNAAYIPQVNRGRRSMRQLFNRFSFFQKLGILRRFLYDEKRSLSPFKSLGYPVGPEKQGRPLFTLRRLSERRVSRLTEWARPHEATLNDLLVTALLRAVIGQRGWDGDSALRVLGTVDCRRYLPGRRAEALCNLSGFMLALLEGDPGRDFAQTLAGITRSTREAKQDYFGLSYLMGMFVMVAPYPYFLKRWIANMLFLYGARNGNQPIGLTNLGPIDEARLNFGDAPVSRAEVIVPPAVPPFSFFGLSGYRGSLTLSAGIYESSVERETIEDLFTRVEHELPGG